MVAEDVLLQGVAPVVAIADDQRRQVERLAEQRVVQQVADLPERPVLPLTSPICTLKLPLSAAAHEQHEL